MARGLAPEVLVLALNIPVLLNLHINTVSHIFGKGGKGVFADL